MVLVVFALSFQAMAVVSAANAQTVGSHLGVGDYSGQINNIQILRSNGAGAGFPVTALLNINTAIGNEQGMQSLAAAISSAGFFPIVRITHVCDGSLNQSKLRTGITNINAAFGPNVIIAYGNEVNNKEKECSDWAQYVKEYQWISDMPNVVPAALDYYMGNPAFTAAEFFKTPGATEIYAGGSFVANAYGCVGAKEPSCDPSSTSTQGVGYNKYSGSNYSLTEFSLSPEGGAIDAPDTNIEKVIQFIQEQAGSTGAQYITPLVRNVCNSEGEWLLYVNGKLFTMAGTEVTENCENTVSEGSGYDLSQYPLYDVDQLYYYLHPIKGVHPLSTPLGKYVAVARDDLANQGYEPHCAAEPTQIGLQYNTRELIQRFIDLYPEGIVLNTRSAYGLNSQESEVSIFRDTTGTRYLTTSGEEYFGFKDVYNEDVFNRELSTAAINSLLAEEQKCIQAVRILRDTQLMCERLQDPGKCAPLGREVPGTDYTVSTLLGDVAEAIPAYRAGGIRSGCHEIYGTDDPVYDKVKRGIQNTPLNIDRSYRLAFFVASIENRAITEQFNFFSLKPEADPEHEVLVVAFKIPDIITNKGGGEESGHTFFTDSATHTRNVLVPAWFKTGIYDVESQERRNEIRGAAEGATNQSLGDEIYCVIGSGNTPAELKALVGSPACKDVLGKALVDIINGKPPSCDELDSEPARKILEAANIMPPTSQDGSRVFNPGYGFGTDILRYLLQASTNQGPQRAQNGGNPFHTELRINSDWTFPTETAEARFYLVYPVGYELESVTNVLQHTFFTEEQIETLAEKDTKDRFDTAGFKANLIGGTVSHTFQEKDLSLCDSHEETRYYIDLPDGTTMPVPPYQVTIYDCDRTFSIAVKEAGNGTVKILGAHLGFWMRNIQQALNTYFGYAHAYVVSCETTEEFLTGTCRGGFANSPGDDETVSSTCPMGTGPCSVANLLPYFEAAHQTHPNIIKNPEVEAEKASRICQRESGSNPNALNDRCLTGTSVDYSVGLFQINALAQCEEAFADGAGNPGGSDFYDPYDLPCTIIDQAKLDSCISQFNTVEGNIKKMVSMRVAWQNWEAWSAAGACNIQ